MSGNERVSMTVDFFWLAFAVLIVGMSYIKHLQTVDCLDRGGVVVDGLWKNTCKRGSAMEGAERD